jgi:AraC-like DNA-binding protein
MDFTLMTREDASIGYPTSVPPSLARYKVPGAREVYGTGEFGTVLFYEQSGVSFSIWSKSYLMKQSTYLGATPQGPLFQLYFAISRDMRYQQKGLGKIVFPEGQFNILYTPAVQHQQFFDKGRKYCVYEIHFDRSYLEKLVPYFSFMPEFLMKAELGFPCLLNPVHAHITPAMMTALHNMLHCPYTGEVKKEYLEALWTKTLLQAVTRLAPVKHTAHEVKLQPYELNKLRETWEYLLHNLDNPGTLMDLSHTIGLNDFKLKKGFKQLYGVTIFEFLIQARMEKARQLLQETDMTVHAVAIAVGYKNISSFTVAYKKKFGLLPSEVRRYGA